MNVNKNKFDSRVLMSVMKVYRKKVSGCVAHAGVILNFDRGEQLVLHTNPGKNTHLSTIEEFADGEKLVKKTSINATQEIVNRINSRLSTNLKYSVANNCEHLASEVLTGCATSAQLKTSLAFAAVGTGLVACKATNRNVLTLSLAVLGFGILGLNIEKKNQLSS